MSDEAQSRADAWVEAAPAGTPARALRERAREWADRVSAATGLSGGWRMQVLSLRTRRDFRSVTTASGDPASPLTTSFGTPAYAPPSDQVAECPDRPMRVRRFASGCPWPLVEQVARYLHAVAPYAGVVFDGAPTGAVWRPTLTQWTRDAQAQTGPDATCTLVQDLVEVTDCGDEEVVASGASCLQAEETRYVWDASSVEGAGQGCPGQGTTISVQAVRRNEDGTFDYQVVVSRARSRHVPAHAVQCDAAHSATEERWEDLYGEPGSLRASGLGDEPAPCDGLSAGESLSGLAPASCSQTGAGVTVRWDVQLNRDCTYSVSKTVSSAKEQSGSWSDADGCRVSSHSLVRGSSSAPPSVRSASPGTRVDVRATLDDDGTWSWERTETSAPASVDASWEDGTPCRPRAVTLRLDARSLAAVKAVVPERSAGTSVDAQLSRNADCTWDARVAVTEAPEPGYERWEDGSECRPRRHARGTDYRSFAAAEAAASAEHPLEPGWTVDAQFSRNEDCTWDFTSVKARASAEWEAEWVDGSECRPRENVRAAGLASLAEAKAKVHVRAAGYAVQADVRMAEDCTWEVSSSRAKTSAAWDADWEDGSECRPRENRVRTGLASLAEAKGLVHSALRGRTVQADIRMEDDCTWTLRSSRTKTSAEWEAEWEDGSACRPRENLRRAGIASMGEARSYVHSLEAGYSVQADVRMADDCTWEVSSSKVKGSPSLPDGGTWTDGTRCSTATHQLYSGSDSIPAVQSPAAGEEVRARFSLSEDCTYSGEVVRTRSTPSRDLNWTEGSQCRPVEVTVYENQTGMPANLAPSSGQTVGVSVRRNADCSLEVRREVSDLAAHPYSRTITWIEDGNTVTHVDYRNQTAPLVVSGDNVVNSFRLNEACLYDGYSETRVRPGGSSGGGYTWGPNVSGVHLVDYAEDSGGFRVKYGWFVEGSQKERAFNTMLRDAANSGYAVEGLSTRGGYASDEVIFTFTFTKVVSFDADVVEGDPAAYFIGHAPARPSTPG